MFRDCVQRLFYLSAVCACMCAHRYWASVPACVPFVARTSFCLRPHMPVSLCVHACVGTCACMHVWARVLALRPVRVCDQVLCPGFEARELQISPKNASVKSASMFVALRPRVEVGGFWKQFLLVRWTLRCRFKEQVKQSST